MEDQGELDFTPQLITTEFSDRLRAAINQASGSQQLLEPMSLAYLAYAPGVLFQRRGSAFTRT
jgi:hypothetical protein